jgi:hypothetical protein
VRYQAALHPVIYSETVSRLLTSQEFTTVTTGR